MQMNQQIIPALLNRHPVRSAVAEPLRVVVVDDSPGFLEVACALLELEDGIEIVGTGKDGTEAIHAVANLRPDVLLMDIQMPYMNGLTAALLVSEHFPAVKVVLMSSDGSLPMRIACQSSGARAFVYKPEFKIQLSTALEKIHHEPVFRP